MSTKAYTGFRMVSKHFPTVLADLERASKVLQKYSQVRQDSFVATLATRFVDQADMARSRGKEPAAAGLSPFASATSEMFDRQLAVRRTQRRDPAVDFETSFTLWHCRELDSFIGLLQTEFEREVLPRFLGLGVARSFAYWNNTDPDERVSARAWKQRSRAWAACLDGGSGPPFRVDGLEPDFPGVDAVLALAPEFSERLARVAGDLALGEHFEANADKPTDTQGIFAAHTEYMKARGTPGTKAWEVHQEALELAKRTLRQSLTRADLGIGTPAA